MKIPKKIEPDNLKDTIVQVLFAPNVPLEVFVGCVYAAVSKNFEFVAPSPVKVSEKGVVFEQAGGYFIDKDKKVKIEVSPNAIIFNIYAKYIGWENYFPVIREVLETIFKQNLVKNVNRIGVRYISQFENLSLIENLQMNLQINLPNKSLDSTQIRTEYNEDKFKIIVTLLNKIQRPSAENKEVTSVSVIDIDVIQLFEMKDYQGVISAIDDGHQKQKVTFFSLLREDFLNKLNPVY